METARLGATGPLLTRFALGLAAVGRPAYINLGHGRDFPEGRSPEQMERHAHRLLDAAFDAGIWTFDAARSYGRAEAFLRSWLELRGLAPRNVVVCSKWGYRYTGDWNLSAARHEVKDHSAAALRHQLAESQELLGPHLALYQVHSATAESGVLENGEVLDELARLRDRGVYVGITVSGPGQAWVVRRALQVRRGGESLFASIQATWNLLEPSCGEALREAHESGRLVLVKEPLANGRLTPRGDAGGEGPLREAARVLDTEVDAVALAAVLAQPWADVVLLGPSTVEQLRSNLVALALEPRAGLLHALGALREDPAAYWELRRGLPWS
jgi:aryl-alcohol dehydrogenase-like predicted oxidoreductase